MLERTRLAIVIPYFKIIFLKETLDSLAYQTDKRFKVYIGDDASPDNCSKLLEKYKTKFDFIYHRFENNLGGNSLTKQWNRCIEMLGDEEWFMILGDDDVLSENIVEEFYRFLGNELNTNLIRISCQMIDEKGSAISDVYKQPELETATSFYGRKLQFLTRSSLSEHIIRKEAYDKNGFFDYPLAWCSDDRFFLEVSENLPVYSINDAIVYVRMSTLNISGQDSLNLIKGKTQIDFYTYVLKSYFKGFTYDAKIALINIYEFTWFELYPKRISGNFLYIFFKYLRTGSFSEVLRFIIRSAARLKNIIYK